jgi:DNA polymerase
MQPSSPLPADNDARHQAMNVIRDEVTNLTQSPLYSFRTANTYFPVIGEGSYTADIVFVGEAPGLNEAKKARPFCGASGKFLDVMLAHIGLDRSTVYITNVVKDRPPENRDPTPEEIALYGSFLERQLAIIQPRVLVPLGRHSMKFLLTYAGLGDHVAPISTMHGKVLQGHAPYGGIINVVPLYHPAVALYNGSMRPVLIKDAEVLKQFLR